MSKDKNIRATIDCNIDYFLIKNFQTDFVKKIEECQQLGIDEFMKESEVI